MTEPTPDLTEAERAVRDYLATSGATPEWALSHVMAEYDRRGTELDDTQQLVDARDTEVFQLRTELGKITADQTRTIAALRDLVQASEVLRVQRDAVLTMCTSWAEQGLAVVPIGTVRQKLGQP